MNRDAYSGPAASTFNKASKIGWYVDTLKCLSKNEPSRLEAKRFAFAVLPKISGFPQ